MNCFIHIQIESMDAAKRRGRADPAKAYPVCDVAKCFVRGFGTQTSNREICSRRNQSVEQSQQLIYGRFGIAKEHSGVIFVE